MDNLISKKAVIDALTKLRIKKMQEGKDVSLVWECLDKVMHVPSARPENYTELKKELIRMASYIYVLLECSDEQRETLIGFISRLAEFISWTERD